MSVIIPSVPPVSAGLGGTQPINPPGMAGLSGADRETNTAIQAIVGPSYKGYENYKRGEAWGMTTSGNLNQTAVYDRPPEPVQFIHEQMAEGLEALLAYFEVKAIDPSDRLIKTVALVFNASRWPRITDLTQGDQDMHSSFKTEAATVQVGKMAEIDVKVLNTPLGRRMWYERLKQASNGLLNTITHFCINALLGCSPDKLARTATSNYIAPYTSRLSFTQALQLYIGQFNVIGKGPHGINDLAEILQIVQQTRDNARYSVLITDSGFNNRMTRTMASWVLGGMIHSIVGIPAASETKSYVLSHTSLSQILETGPISVGPNSPKAPPFTRNIMVCTHQIVPAEATGIQIFDRRLDTFVPVSDAELAARVIDLSNNAADDVCSYIFFTLYQAQTSSAAILDTNRQRPELHLSKVTSATTLGGDQLKLGFYAAMTIAAVVPDKNSVLFMNDIRLKQIMKGGGVFADSAVGNAAATAFSLKQNRTRVCVRVLTASIRGLYGDRSILSLFGSFPAAMTNAEVVETWASDLAGAANTAEAKMKATFANSGKPVAISGQFAPESVINGQVSFPYLSTRDACIYTLAGARHVIQPCGIFGKNAYEGCTGDSMGSLGSGGYLRPYSPDVLRMNNP